MQLLLIGTHWQVISISTNYPGLSLQSGTFIIDIQTKANSAGSIIGSDALGEW
ncbi:hypothetical protein D3C87_2178710 [compost metagenome]